MQSGGSRKGALKSAGHSGGLRAHRTRRTSKNSWTHFETDRSHVLNFLFKMRMVKVSKNFLHAFPFYLSSVGEFEGRRFECTCFAAIFDFFKLLIEERFINCSRSEKILFASFGVTSGLAHLS